MKNVVNKILTILIFLSLIKISKAQSTFIVEAGSIYSSFKFYDSTGNKLKYEYPGKLSNLFLLGYNHIFSESIIIGLKLGVRGAGANYIEDVYNYSWELKYVDFRLYAGYIFNSGKVDPFINISGYYSYMVEGIQILNNEHYNIVKLSLLKKTDYGAIVASGVKLDFTDYLSGKLELNYIWGLKNIENNENQKTKNYGYGLSFGLLFFLNK